MGRASGLEPLGLRLGSGTEDALYRRNAGRVFGFCLSRLGRRDDAEDAVQTTFLQAVQSLRRGVVPLTESAWLIGIAKNVCLQRFEAAAKLRKLEATCDPHDLERESAALAEPPEELIGLDDALARLPEQQRQAILLRDWRGLSYAEVAEQLGVSQAAVETLIFRGRGTLAELLREEPQQTRRRLAALGNLGSLFTAIKTAFGGAAAATKLAAAVGITAVAVGGAGVAITAASPATEAPAVPGSAVSSSSAATPSQTVNRQTPQPVRAQTAAAAAQARAASTRPGRAPVAAKKTRPARTAVPTRAGTTSTTAPAPAAASAAAAPPAAAPKLAAIAPAKQLVSRPRVRPRWFLRSASLRRPSRRRRSCLERGRDTGRRRHRGDGRRNRRAGDGSCHCSRLGACRSAARPRVAARNRDSAAGCARRTGHGDAPEAVPVTSYPWPCAV